MGKKIYFQDLYEGIANRSQCSTKTAEDFVREMFEVIEDYLETDTVVKIKGFGTFKLVNVDKRESINVNTGERIEISGHSKVTFTPDTVIKELINKPFAHFETTVLNDGTDIKQMEKVEEPEATPESEVATESVEQPQTIQDAIPSAEVQQKEEPVVGDPVVEQPVEEEPQVEVPLVEKSLAEKLLAKEPIVEEQPIAQKPEIVQTQIDPVVEVPATELIEDIKEPAESIEEEPQKEVESKSETVQPVKVHKNDVETAEEDITDEEPKARKVNIWKVVAMTLISLILLMVSYFAGYFHLFGPNASPAVWFTQPAVTAPQSRPLSPKPAVTPQKEKPVAKVAPVEAKPQAEPAPEEQFAQLKGSKYVIIGTKRTHRVNPGESLQRIAANAYGSKGYVPYILIHNHITNPDQITAGTVLRLPKLKRRGQNE